MPGVVVVGGGPAGVSAALQARELGASVTLLESGQVGGTSLNRGPAPVRTLARAARLVRDWSSWETFGLSGAAPVPDLVKVMANSERVARYAHDKKDMAGRIRRHGVELIEHIGPVRFLDPHTLAATSGDGDKWSAERVIVAVGGHAGSLPIPGAELALTYEDLPSLRTLPRTVAVIGGADTGCQIASILANFGVGVALFEAAPTLLPGADRAVSTELGAAFSGRDIAVRTGAVIEALRSSDAGISVEYQQEGLADRTTVDAVFLAVGWPANLEQLEPDRAGLCCGEGALTVDDYLRTDVEHIFAAGDVNRRSMVVQTARLEGRIAAHNAVLGPQRQICYDVVPTASFTDPEYGRVGLTEAQAAAGHDVVVGVAYYEDLLRPVADGRPEGFCKLVADRATGAILGAHVLGDYSAEIVQNVAAAMAGGMNVEQVAELQLAFPTFTEGVNVAAQKICRQLEIGHFPQVWSYLGAEEDA